MDQKVGPRILLSPPDVGSAEEQAAADAVRSGWVAPLGPHVTAFEEEIAAFIGGEAGSTAALNSGTAALELAMRLTGVGVDDWVLVPTKTFVASANSVLQVGARPVFVDVSSDTWNLDVDRTLEFLEEEGSVGSTPGAVMWVDLYGTCSDLAPLRKWCGDNEVPLIEDAAEALGSTLDGRSAGTLGDIGVLSFNGNKIMTTSGGGMLIASEETATRARWLASQAREPGHGYVHKERGFNYRLSNICAAVGRAQLARLPGMIARRREVRAAYESAFVRDAGLELNPVPEVDETNCWLTVLQLPQGTDPIALIDRLEEHNIEARRSWNPMHLQPLFSQATSIGGDVAESIYDRSVCLPSGSSMTDSDLERVIDTVRAALPAVLAGRSLQ